MKSLKRNRKRPSNARRVGGESRRVLRGRPLRPPPSLVGADAGSPEERRASRCPFGRFGGRAVLITGFPDRRRPSSIVDVPSGAKTPAKRSFTTRLETRTKESNVRASLGEGNSPAQRKRTFHTTARGGPLRGSPASTAGRAQARSSPSAHDGTRKMVN